MHAAQVDGVGRVQVRKTLYNFTDMQDLRMVVGCKAHIDQKGHVTPVSWLHVAAWLRCP